MFAFVLGMLFSIVLTMLFSIVQNILSFWKNIYIFDDDYINVEKNELTHIYEEIEKLKKSNEIYENCIKKIITDFENLRNENKNLLNENNNLLNENNKTIDDVGYLSNGYKKLLREHVELNKEYYIIHENEIIKSSNTLKFPDHCDSLGI
jgi:hypothetical protein